MSAESLESDLFRVLDEVHAEGLEVRITVDGTEVAKLVPLSGRSSLHGSIEMLVSEEELLAPNDVVWDAASK